MSLLLLLAPPGLPWYDKLVEASKRLIADGQHEAAVVTAMMGAEAASENAFSNLLELRGISELEDSIGDLLPSYSLANERVRGLYVSLSGDSIQERPFWAGFKAAASLRNKLIHRGARATADQAQEAVNSTSELVKHLVETIRRLKDARKGAA
jgi:hypothetical protein